MKRNGFVAVGIILIVVIILAVTGGIWYYEAHKSSPTQPTPSTTPPMAENATSSSFATSSEFVIPGWGVEFQVPSSLSGLAYNISNKKDSAAVATFSTNGLDGLAPSCSPSTGQGIGSLARWLYSPTDTPAPTYTHIGDYAYAFIEPTGDCAEPGVLPGGNFTITTTTQLYSQDLGELETAIDNTLTSTPSTPLTTTPTSGPAGTMIVLHGVFSVCITQVSECTEDRFDQPVFLQNGITVATSVVSYSPMEGSGTANDPFRQNGNTAYLVPLSLMPGNYEFAMQNCLGKGCSNYHIAWFTVVASANATVPAINSINSQIVSSTSLAGATITIHGNNFSTSDNYISMWYDDQRAVGYTYVYDASSSDGKTITFQLPACSTIQPSICELTSEKLHSIFDNSYRIAVSNSNGTSNFATFKTQ